MPSGELDFQRIARQAREFREKEEQRIAAEKEEEARRIAAKKEVEREQIAQRQQKYMEKEQEQRLDQETEQEDNALLPSASFDSKSSKPSPGTVKRRADWLRGLEADAAARRRLEDEFNALLEARRRANPHEAQAVSEAAVKEAMYASDDSRRSRSYSRHSHSLHSVMEENEKPHVFELETVFSGEMVKESARESADETEDAKEQETIGQETIPTQKNQVDIDDIDEEPGKIPNPQTASPVVVEAQSIKDDIEKPTTKEQQFEPTTIEPDDLQYGAEVDPRTQAMLAEDNLIPSGGDFANMSLTPNSTDRDKKKLVLENSIPVSKKSLKSKGSSKNNVDDDDDLGSEVVHKEATFELPVELTEDGLVFSPNSADLNMMTTIPPSRIGGRVSGRLEGKSNFGNVSNTASGSASLEYKASRHSRFTLGMIRGCEAYHPLIMIGGRLLRHGSSIGVTFYHNAKFLHQMMLEHSLWSLSFQHSFRNSNWSLSSELSRRKDLSLALKNGTKLSGMIGWNLLKSNQFQARIDARPKITEYRRAHLYCHWQVLSGSGVWNFGVSLVQNLHSQIATFGLGWRVFSARGLEWVISWSRGNATIRIPIVVSKGLAPTSTIGHSLYVSIASYLIQEYIAEVWGWVGNGDQVDDESAETNRMLAIRAEFLTKARKDAGIQKELMSRQARRKVKDEKEKDGLIITKAVYQIENVEEWDVTIPLQFWVSGSKLVLTAGPKSQLLGFYDIAASVKNSRARSSANDESQPKTPSRQFPSWRDICYDLLDWSPQDKSRKGSNIPSPTLSVWYEFKGQSYEITVKDREELRLPAV
eukprot:CAMPEP_0116155408 /NCGR_PEP_ID=MMETSP0329-20121206/22294_1 /TAXON_ID=697910 /ORGANISM="Pseudo-nitzschia arenysensis, Strain B593" /LENGTH=816 /DNA_ID=CAMNT_0003652445 /DNA_START=64 /DNA_END=2514 /DNA_ORIENTATION=+